MTMSFQRKFLLPMMCLAMPTAATAQVQMFPTMESIRETVPDRVEVVAFMLDSSMHFFDMNNDGGISDTDVAFMVEDRLMELYGPDLNIPDLDGDGALTGEDMVTAITTILASPFGDIDGTGETVTGDDVMVAGSNLNAGSPNADVNFDGTADLIDVLEVDNQIGNQVNEWDIETAARSIFTYIGFIREQGRAYFIPEEAPPPVHLKISSKNWPPNFPRWWQPNHLTTISESYSPQYIPPPGHASYITQNEPGTPAPHASSVSKRWPANHHWEATASWPVRFIHGGYLSNGIYKFDHDLQLSKLWPAGHYWSASATWAPNHNLQTSYGWWPNHNEADSNTAIFPPLHGTAVSSTWSHAVLVSQAAWPPGHLRDVSLTWSWQHAIGMSASWPPNHVVNATNTWPGRQPSWPPSHTESVSRTWGDPVPGTWPLFPPGHSWYTTFQDIISPILPRVPWAGNP